MLVAVRNKNFPDFKECLDRGFDVRCQVRSIPFVERVARSCFFDALRTLLVEIQPCPIRIEDARRAFNSCLRLGAPRTIIGVFIEASLSANLPILAFSECFLYAMQSSHSTMAVDVVSTAGFNCNLVIPLLRGGWECALHFSIRREQYEVSQRLLEIGAEPDSGDCNGVTPLMFCCGLFNIQCVRILLAYGSDPNAKPNVLNYIWPLRAKLSSTPKFPDFKSIKESGATLNTEKADKIIELLICAGLRPTPGNWLERTQIVAHMSQKSGLALRKLCFQMPSLVGLAITQGRQAIRAFMSRRRSLSFNEAVNILNLPYGMKQQLAVNLI